MAGPITFSDIKDLEFSPFPTFSAFAEPISDKEEEDIEILAEDQIKKERQSENYFLKILDMLGRPQAAIAGVLKDAVDGGGFSPVDRVTEALLGNERYGVKEVLDEIFPGVGPTIKMPGFLGGSELDVFKSGFGFLGDVLTDPLMYTGIGHLLSVGKGGKLVRKIGAEEMEFAAKELKFLEGTDKTLHNRLQREVFENQALHNEAVALHMESSLIKTRKMMGIWKQRFYAAVTGKGIPEGELSRIEDLMKEYRKFEWAAPTVAEQFAQGQRAILSMDLGPFQAVFKKFFGAKALTDISVVKKLDETLGKNVASMISASFEGLSENHVYRRIADSVKNWASASSGNELLDHFALKASRHLAYNNEVFKSRLGELRDAFGGRLDNDYVNQVMDYVVRSHLYGGTVREVPKEIAESVNKVRGVIRGWEDFQVIQGIKREVFDFNSSLPLQKAWAIAMDDAVNILSKEKKMKIKHKDLKYHGMKTDWNEVNKFLSGKLKKEWENAADPDKARKFFFWKMREDINVVKNHIAKSDVPISTTGPFPLVFTNEAKAAFDTLLKDERIMYGEKKAYDYLSSIFGGRAFDKMSVPEINEALQNRQLPYYFLNDVIDQVKRVSKSDKNMRKNMWSFFHKSGVENWELFHSNPFFAYQDAFAKSVRSVSNHHMIKDTLSIFARQVDTQKIPKGPRKGRYLPYASLGEDVVILNERGMVAMYGANWRVDFRKKFGKRSVNAYDTIKREYGIRGTDPVEGAFLSVDPSAWKNAMIKNIPVFYLNKDVKEGLNRFLKIKESPEQLNVFMRSYKEVTDFFKGTSLGIFPGYHARNVFGNFWMSFLAGTMNPQNYITSLKLMNAAKYGIKGGLMKDPGVKAIGKVLRNPLEDIKITNELTGEIVMDGVQFMEEFNKRIMHGSFWMEEVAREMPTIGSAPKLTALQKATDVAVKTAKQFTHKGKPVQTGFMVGQYIENWQKIGHVIGELRKGKHIDDAVASMRKYFFDYTQFSEFEKNVMRQVIPFYSWVRKNIPLQLEAMITQPHKFSQLGRVAEALQSDEVKDMDKAILPKWVNRNFGLPTRINKNTGDIEVSILKSWLPAADLMPIMEANPIKGIAQVGGEMLHPLIKTAIEMKTNRNMYTGDNVQDYPGEPIKYLGTTMSKKSAHLLRNVRAINEINNLFTHKTPTGDLEIMERLSSLFAIAPKVKSFDIDYLVSRYKNDVQERKSAIKKVYSKAKKRGDQETVDYFKKLLEDTPRFLR